MKFLLQLDEASNLPLDKLKAAMKKDPRVNQILQKDLKADEIKNPAQFITTLRYYLFSNPSVREYVTRRGDARHLSSYWWKRWSSTKPTEVGKMVTDYEVEMLRQLVKDLFKDVGVEAKGADISKENAEDLYHFLSGKRSTDLHPRTVRELLSLPLRPAKSIPLYRGVVFSEDSMRETTKWGGFSEGTGLKFLQSVRKGTRIVDLKCEHHTVWTKDKQVALRMALGKESWDTEIKDRKLGKYKGVMSFLISTLATPDEIVVDMDIFRERGGVVGTSYTNDVILKPGTLVTRIVNKFTTQGEEDPVKHEDAEDTLDTLRGSLVLMGKILKLPLDHSPHYQNLESGMHNAEVRADAGKLVQPEVTDKTKKMLTAFLAYYAKHLAHIDVNSLASAAGTEAGPVFSALKRVTDIMNEGLSVNSRTDRRGKPGGYANWKELTGDEAWDMSLNDGFVRQAATLAREGRITKSYDLRAVESMATMTNPEYADMHRKGTVIQQAGLKVALQNAFQVLEIEESPTSIPDAIAKVKATAAVANRNAIVLKMLWSIKDALTKLSAD